MVGEYAIVSTIAPWHFIYLLPKKKGGGGVLDVVVVDIVVVGDGVLPGCLIGSAYDVDIKMMVSFLIILTPLLISPIAIPFTLLSHFFDSSGIY